MELVINYNPSTVTCAWSEIISIKSFFNKLPFFIKSRSPVYNTEEKI